MQNNQIARAVLDMLTVKRCEACMGIAQPYGGCPYCDGTGVFLAFRRDWQEGTVNADPDSPVEGVWYPSKKATDERTYLLYTQTLRENTPRMTYQYFFELYECSESKSDREWFERLRARAVEQLREEQRIRASVPESPMTPEGLSDAVADVVRRAQDRVGPDSIGAQQYHVEGQPQKFETMELLDLIDYSIEEALDLINYGVMNVIRFGRLRNMAELVQKKMPDDSDLIEERAFRLYADYEGFSSDDMEAARRYWEDLRKASHTQGYATTKVANFYRMAREQL